MSKFTSDSSDQPSGEAKGNCGRAARYYGVALLAVGFAQVLLGACLLLSLISNRHALVPVIVLSVAAIPVAIGALVTGMSIRKKE